MAAAREKLFRAGALIYIENEEDTDEVYILEEGSVELANAAGTLRFRPAVGPGDIFGFTSCLCRRPRMESAKARSDSRVAALDREKFLELVQSNPELATKIISYFAEELRAYDEMMAGNAAADDYTGEDSRLFALGEQFLVRQRNDYAAHALSSYLRHYPEGIHAAEAREKLGTLPPAAPEPARPAAAGLARSYPDRAMIFCEHEPGDELYIIKTGKVEITKATPPEEILLSVLREGDIFGELSIVSRKPRNASAIAAGEVTLLPITRASLPALFERSPAIIGRILIAVSQRIWFTFIRVQSQLYENPLTRAYVLLENKLLEQRISLTSTHPVVLPLSIGDLLGMAGVPDSRHEAVKAALTDDVNLVFQFRQVTIESPSTLATKARYHRARDHLVSPELERAKTPRKQPSAARPIGLDPRELRVPPESIP